MTMNKTLLLLMVVVFMAVGALIMNVSDRDEERPADVSPSPVQDLSHNTALSEAEKDTYVNTVATIKLDARQAVKNLDQKYQDFVAEIKESTNDVPNRLEMEQQVEERLSKARSQLTREFDERLRKMKVKLEKQIQTSSPSKSNPDSSRNAGDSETRNRAGIPDGFGFDNLSTTDGGVQHASAQRSTGWSTVMPMRAATGISEGKEGLLDMYTKNLGSKSSQSTVSQKKPGQAKDKTRKTTPKSSPGNDDAIPAYTIPRNATLFSNSTMTKMLGVIPVEGSVLDPIRFKVITGNTNMATNGLYIPGVRDIVWSGIAVGNREMSCVRGELYSVTFTFEDGTIRTISSNKSSTSSTKSGSKRILAYISDRQGSPCLKGTYISNASDYLRDRIIASGAAGAADAFTSTQQTTVSRADGSLQSYFTGKTSDIIASSMASGGLRELTEYLRERNRNAIDMVVLDAGKEVVMHIEQQIEIDYEPNGRRLEYANPLSSMAKTGYRLD